MFNKIWNFWNDMKVPLGVLTVFTIILTCYNWWWLFAGIAAIGGLYW